MKKPGAKYKGIITGLLMMVLSVLFFYVLKLPVNGRNQFLILLVFTAGIVWSLVSFKQHAPAAPAFKDYFSEGFKTFIVITFLMAVFTFVFYTLNPQIMEDGIKVNNMLVMKEGNHTDAEINANADKLRNIFMPMMLALNTIKYLLLGSVFSIVTAAFLMRRHKY